jgi:hypothetical protein
MSAMSGVISTMRGSFWPTLVKYDEARERRFFAFPM